MEAWIKMRTHITDDPKVYAMASELLVSKSFLKWAGAKKLTINAAKYIVAGLLIKIWGAVRMGGVQDGDDQVIKNSDEKWVDDQADRIEGFGKAMEKVGWLIIKSDEKVLIFPKFSTQNAPKSNADKQREYRQRKRLCQNDSNEFGNTDVTFVTTREEKRREEKKEEDSLRESCPTPPTAAIVPTLFPEEYVLTFPIVKKRSGKYKGIAEWGLTQEKLAEYADTFTGFDVLADLKKARQWCIDNPSKIKTHEGMASFLGRWLSKTQNESGGRQTGSPRPNGAFEMARRNMAAMFSEGE